MQRYIYIIVSKTDTALGRVIQNALGVCYNHCSISLDSSLEESYSFGRNKLHNMFRAGFVCESKNRGCCQEHDTSRIRVMEVPVTEEQWRRIAEEIEEFENHRERYKYSALGLVFCYFGISKERQNKYFCSQFVAELLERADAKLIDKPSSLVRPHDFIVNPRKNHL